jgi:hypothetical protein
MIKVIQEPNGCGLHACSSHSRKSVAAQRFFAFHKAARRPSLFKHHAAALLSAPTWQGAARGARRDLASRGTGCMHECYINMTSSKRGAKPDGGASARLLPECNGRRGQPGRAARGCGAACM